MQLVNAVDIESRWGLRTFELRQGSLLDLDETADLLAVSAFSDYLDTFAVDPGVYTTVAHTVIGALYQNAGIDVAALRAKPSLDLRSALGCWFSDWTPSPKIRRILCIEDIGRRVDARTAIHDAFVALSVAEAKGIVANTFVLPLLGAGDAKLDPATIVAELLVHARKHLVESQHVKRIVFVERDPEKARTIDAAMNDALARVRVSLPRGQVADAVRADLARVVEIANAVVSDQHRRVLADFARLVGSPEARSFEIGLVARRLVEAVVADVFGKAPKGYDLVKNIDSLAEKHVADWIRSYMHVLRVLGNESAHERQIELRLPPTVTDADLSVVLLCAKRIIEFWIEHRCKR
jgi:Domain of unknown function (DUF4145)